ncbi:hypothetical protein GGX14DRAFT_472237 [Mycena pura]|uniref:PHD-type domain-containing protein n=1 Tax=Mycena pura TaxID=153505 RepID=A0AAD6UXJ8_9AGAR|nr:hypothetical protein GGX14DRAFT_472237 [Mycena pura]
MSARPSRKRRRSQAFPELEDEQPIADVEGSPKYVQSTGQDRLDKEREVWDAFKDEHVEVFDLSSSLWRKFVLVRELDQQDARNTASLLSAFLKYVALRRATQPRLTVDAPESNTLEHTDRIQQHSTFPADQYPSPNGVQPSSSKQAPAALPQSAPPDQSNSREMLAMIGKLSEASVHDREEKVNLTRAVCDSVERSIRLIDQAIQEQEHAISLGARPGTRLAPILLPEVVMPRWSKPVRDPLSPELDDALGGFQTAPPQARGRKKGRKGRKAETAETVVLLPRPNPPVILNPDPNERRYCYCDQVSFGEMIACDDPRCEREWFHFSCTNLAAAPEGRKKWFCDDCILRKSRKRIR